MEETLQRSDIVGKAVSRVFTTEWVGDDGCVGCGVFVELSDGIVFPLEGVDFGEVVPIRRIDPRVTPMWPAEEQIQNECRGRTVVEVLASESWPTLGLLLTGAKLLFVMDLHIPMHRVGPCVVDLDGSIYKEGVHVPYWSQA